MELVKGIITILLILVISCSGIPVYLAEDASHNGTIDLADVILQAQDIVQSGDITGSFSLQFEKIVNTLSSLASLKSIIDPNSERKSSNHSANFILISDKINNSCSILLYAVQIGIVQYPENSFIYESRFLDPTTPPPRSA